MKFPFCSLLPASTPAGGNDVGLLGHPVDCFWPRSLDAGTPINSSVTHFVPGTLTQESHTRRTGEGVLLGKKIAGAEQLKTG